MITLEDNLVLIDHLAALFFTEKLIALAILFQSIEMILIKEAYSEQGIWRWSTLKKEFKIFSRLNFKFLNLVFTYRGFLFLLILRCFAALGLFLYSDSSLLLVLLLSTVLVSLRFRGTFNGGSDYMSVLILLALTISSVFENSFKVAFAALTYIAVQLLSSYFIAGLVKLRRVNWRSGSALKGFLNSTIYQDDFLTHFLCSKRSLLLVLSASLISFELSFVLSLIHPFVCLVYLFMGFLFHLGNFYLFGLNRFVFAWLAGYPALYFCSNLVYLWVS